MNKSLRFLLAAMLMALLGIGQAQNTQWYGYILGSFGGDSWQNRFVSFNTQNPSSVQSVSETFPQINAATYLDGYVWYVTATRSLCKAPFNEETHTVGTPETVVPLLDQYRLIVDMSYNPVDGRMYYLCQDSQYNSSLKYSDLATPSVVETVGTFNVKLWTLAINSQGQAYGIAYESGNLHHVDLTDATTTVVGPTGKEVWYTQSMAFDLDNNVLYWAQLSTANDHGFYQVNTQTGAVTALGEIGGSGVQLSGLFMVPETTPEPVVKIIDFETGDFSQFPFNNTFDIPWQIFEEASGNLCMRSGNREQHSTTSIIEATYNFAEPGYIYFDGKCRGEGTAGSIYDRCRFYIDGTMQFEYGNNGSVWNPYSFDVAAGSHTFRWEYTKDGNVNPEGDYFAVDNIKFATGSPCMAPTNISVTLAELTNATITWNGNSPSYTLRYKLVSESDWTTLTGITENTYALYGLPFGHYELEIQSDCDEGNWTSITFTVADEPVVITEVFILGYTAPAWGEHPDYDIEVDPTAPYTIEEVIWRRYDDNVDVVVEPDDYFNLENVYYYLYILLSQKEGYVFDDNPMVYFDGDDSVFDFGSPVYHGYRVLTIEYQLTNPEGVEEQTAESLSVRPNPVENTLIIDGLKGEMVRVYDNTGRLVLEQHYEGQLDISHFVPGVYAVTVSGHTMKFIKN